ncbi:MAG: glycosyltransferase family 39 protein [Pseudomonadota bacterium]
MTDTTEEPARVAAWSALRIDLCVVLALTAFAFAVRVLWLDHRALHIDEFHSINYARQSLADLFALDRATDIHPPVFFASIKAWVAVFGDGRLSVRLFMVLESIAAIPLFYVILRHFLDWKTAALAGLFFAVAPMQIHYGRFVRMYPLLTLFYLVAFLCYLRALRAPEGLLDSRRATPWLVLLGGVSLTLAFMTHYTAPFIFFCFALIAVVQLLRGRPGEFWVIVVMLGIGTLLAVPQTLHLLSQMGDPDMKWMLPTTPMLFYEMSTGAYPYPKYLKPLMYLVLLWGAYQLWLRDRDMAIRMGMFLAAGPLIAAIVGIWHPIYLVRTIQLFTIFSSVLLVLAILSWRRPAAWGLGVVSFAATLAAMPHHYYPERESDALEFHAPVREFADLERDRVFVFFRLHREARYFGAGWIDGAHRLDHKTETADMAALERALGECFGDGTAVTETPNDAASCRSVVVFAEVDPVGDPAPGERWDAFLDDLAERYGTVYDASAARIRGVVFAEDPLILSQN